MPAREVEMAIVIILVFAVLRLLSFGRLNHREEGNLSSLEPDTLCADMRVLADERTAFRNAYDHRHQRGGHACDLSQG
jgi:hypothetical protein